MTANSPCPACGCELDRESECSEGYKKEELRKLREELRKKRAELRELRAQLADAYIKQDGPTNYLQTPEGFFLIRGWGIPT
jgi:DNA repair exonuclease SbcCD ATPase subunit